MFWLKLSLNSEPGLELGIVHDNLVEFIRGLKICLEAFLKHHVVCVTLWSDGLYGWGCSNHVNPENMEKRHRVLGEWHCIDWKQTAVIISVAKTE